MNKVEKALKVVDYSSYNLIAHYHDKEFSHTIHIMFKNGSGYCRVYWFDDDPVNIYLEYLTVSKAFQKQGKGAHLQVLRESIGRAIGATKSNLWVMEGTWMQEWYRRRGYVDTVPHEKEPGSIWMEKNIRTR